MVDLFNRVKEETSLEDVYDALTEDQDILVPRAIAYFSNIDWETASCVGDYCYKRNGLSSNESLKK